MGFLMLSEIKISLIKSRMNVQSFLFALIPQGKPTLFTGEGASIKLSENIAGFGHKKILIITDEILHKLGVLDGIKQTLEKAGVDFVVFDEVLPDPTYAIVDAGTACYRKENCDAVLAVGGGSSIDAAKAIALAASNRVKNSIKLAGVYRGRRGPVPLYAVPTTAGTGSEVTLASVISDSETHAKLPIVDHRTLPLAAALDPVLMTGMPKPITAATGMDALTHAVESFIATTSTRNTELYSRSAIKAIFEHLPRAYHHGEQLNAREAMAMASFNAGFAFSKTLVGYVHGIAHQLGAFYGTPHGLANALVLPHVLEFSADVVEQKLATLAADIGVAKAKASDADNAQAFIDAVYHLQEEVKVLRQLDALKTSDIRAIAKAALKESHSSYAVPKYMSLQDCEVILQKMLKEEK